VDRGRNGGDDPRGCKHATSRVKPPPLRPRGARVPSTKHPPPPPHQNGMRGIHLGQGAPQRGVRRPVWQGTREVRTQPHPYPPLTTQPPPEQESCHNSGTHSNEKPPQHLPQPCEPLLAGWIAGAGCHVTTTERHPQQRQPPTTTAASPCSRGGWWVLTLILIAAATPPRRPHNDGTTQHPSPAPRATARGVDRGC
jgi:hypothetical protein